MKWIKVMTIRILSILTRRDFWFVMIVYPGMFFLATYILSLLKKPVGENAAYFGFITFMFFVFVVCMSIAEIFTRKFKHELQGAKLDIRKREGVDLLNDVSSDK